MNDRPLRPVRVVSAALWLLGSTMPARCLATDDPRFDFPQLDAPQEERGPAYSYYYVPRLAEINQRLGGLFQSGRVRLDPKPGAGIIERYAAYSCQGTLHPAGAAAPVVDVDWTTVRTLRRGPGGHGPAIVIESPGLAGRTPLVLYVSDAATRDLLQEALAVLVTSCRPRPR
jgi:hypothetical protein